MDISLLIVDDHPTIRESLCYVFAAAGVKDLQEASTCAEALRIVREEHVDLVLLDVALPDGNGLDVLYEVQAVAPALPVVMHSYHDKPLWLARSYRLGARGYVVKGVDKNILVDAVERAARGESTWTAEQLQRIRTIDAERGEFAHAGNSVTFK